MIDRRYDFLGVRINATNLKETTEFLLHYNYGQVGYVSFPDSSVVASAQKNEDLREILNQSILTVPDGMPSAFYGWWKGFKNVSTVSGYWLCQNLLNSNLTHYFLGSTEEKLKNIQAEINENFPRARVLAYCAPPFHEKDYFELGNLLAWELKEINQLKPDLIWVGLSSPKQDYLMKYHAPNLHHGIMLGVGGVFDYLSGDVKKSPEWIKKMGLRWLWRVFKEPKRLGPKYWMTIKVFSFVIARNCGSFLSAIKRN